MREKCYSFAKKANKYISVTGAVCRYVPTEII